MTSKRSYSELLKLKTFADRFEYLKLTGTDSDSEFGIARSIGQPFYRSEEWKKCRRDVIVRDNGCDLGIPGYEIHHEILVHHINPLTIFDFEMQTENLMSLENLITTTKETHNAIHYGSHPPSSKILVVREPGDTKLW